MLADAFRRVGGLRLKDKDDTEQILKLLPPATEQEIDKLAARLPCPIPAEILEAMRVTAGLANGPLESFSLVDIGGFGLEEIFPCAYSIAGDGFGNFWVVDLLPNSTNWSPVFYVCHDPPVVAYQSPTIESFLTETVAMWEGGPRSPVDIVHEDAVMQLWRKNSGVLSAADLQQSPDPVLQKFAVDLPPSALVADLRNATVGDGFSWGRRNTSVRRAGEERVWAIIPAERTPGLLTRIFRRSP
jgi:hypothetical protein